MTIEHFNSAQVRIADTIDGLHIAADVTIADGKATNIGNGRVTRLDEDGIPGTPIAEFSSYPGANHRTLYGEPTLDDQLALMTRIDAFCTDVRAKQYGITAE
ncbi:MAG: hypothetical protein K2G07_03905 [Muribaculaceae bacterium]|nr:hypothetical protein [Muribaculaceae bacterium]